VAEVRQGLRETVVIAEMAPDMAVTKARKVLEFIVREVYQRRLAEPPGTRPLENLLQRLVKDGFFPVRPDAYANTVRKLGNLGTHMFNEPVTPEDVYQSLTQLLPILEWYFEVERPRGAASDQKTPKPERPAAVDLAGPRSARVTIVPKGCARSTPGTRTFFCNCCPDRSIRRDCPSRSASGSTASKPATNRRSPSACCTGLQRAASRRWSRRACCPG
jgi:hypothetical protein